MENYCLNTVQVVPDSGSRDVPLKVGGNTKAPSRVMPVTAVRGKGPEAKYFKAQPMKKTNKTIYGGICI